MIARSRTGYHAYPARAKGTWSVRHTGSTRAYRTGLTEEDAWAMAKRLAEACGQPAYLHDKTGRIRTRHPTS